MDTAQLTALIKKSLLLTDQERTYWLSTVDKMMPEQQQRLEEILARAEGIPWTEQLQSYLSAVGGAMEGVFAASPA